MYFESLHNRPLLTKSITAAVFSASANYLSQKLDSSEDAPKDVDPNSIIAYGLFGLLFGGSVPHYFYKFIEKITQEVRHKKNWQFLLQRILFTPVMTALSLYFLAIFEGSSAQGAMNNLLRMYKNVLIANWKFLTIPVWLNFKYIHPMLRVFVTNVIGFFWTVYLANKRRVAKKKALDDIRDMRKNKTA